MKFNVSFLSVSFENCDVGTIHIPENSQKCNNIPFYCFSAQFPQFTKNFLPFETLERLRDEKNPPQSAQQHQRKSPRQCLAFYNSVLLPIYEQMKNKIFLCCHVTGTTSNF